ncbi:hypothetical protein FIV00_22165 [Labrenzia sp. THAF82]|uniref:hypothetical protein n=1 Tax=Labrenzia sp. THAF82 TaxID=2587861 RepID=UPI0012683595|nr:hypothetical protein [Labrenzia sp. THAF82]QFT33213.1 hypothetical protein FIV00_22165 [Labrenzia sp. THAF82]
MKLGCKFLSSAFVTWACAFGPALACPQPVSGEYDKPSLEDALGFVANVVAYELQITEESVCQKTTYDIQEVLIGEYEGLLTSEVCYANDEDFQGEKGVEGQIEEMSGYDRMIGNYPGALVPKIVFQTQYRPAITSCWPVYQLDIGELPEEKRHSLISEYREELKESLVSEATAGQAMQNTQANQ